MVKISRYMKTYFIIEINIFQKKIFLVLVKKVI